MNTIAPAGEYFLVRPSLLSATAKSVSLLGFDDDTKKTRCSCRDSSQRAKCNSGIENSTSNRTEQPTRLPISCSPQAKLNFYTFTPMQHLCEVKKKNLYPEMQPWTVSLQRCWLIVASQHCISWQRTASPSLLLFLHTFFLENSRFLGVITWNPATNR